MFFGSSLVVAQPFERVTELGNKPAFSKQVLANTHYVAAGADFALGAALLVIGILGSQLGFLSSGLSFALIGSGSAYAIAIVSVVLGVRFYQNQLQSTNLLTQNLGNQSLDNIMDRYRT